ncbi:hypothetical protein [Rhizobium sp. 16-449-1b]|uniref:hypothetical protein n=1 Tax=Rhizobium sp. 16-449-1b TaxID=2819989 RepID=UPI001FFE1367|nr:hypothetical protein [Rhizobium sp. 16-449-1b]
MSSTVFDSLLFRDMFGTAAMRAVFSDAALVGRYLEAEAALARAQAGLGTIPASAGDAIDAAAKSIKIDYDRRANLDLTDGLIVAEAVMLAAASKLGGQDAYDVVYEACRTAIETSGRLADVLKTKAEVVSALGGDDAIEHACDPANYLGLCGEMVDRVLAGRG